MKYIDFNILLKQELKDPEFRKEYEALEPEFEAIRERLRKQAIRKPTGAY